MKKALMLMTLVLGLSLAVPALADTTSTTPVTPKVTKEQRLEARQARLTVQIANAAALTTYKAALKTAQVWYIHN